MTRTYLKKIVIRDSDGLFIADGENVVEAMREIALRHLTKRMRVIDQDEGHRWNLVYVPEHTKLLLTADSSDCCSIDLPIEALI
ncbi:hypothetical protein [Xanthomonas campestris]|uniref:hypothetical protein n=1 Tax=Xanthomonas campestris TaxID=339 RepID=UPI00403A0C87